MHRPDTCTPTDEHRRRLSARIVTGVVALTAVVTLTGVTSALASAQEQPAAHHSVRVAHPSRSHATATSAAKHHRVGRKTKQHHPAQQQHPVAARTVAPSAVSADTRTASAVKAPATSSTSSAAPKAATAATTPTTTTPAAGTASRLFSAASPWNTAIAANAAKDPNSAQIVSSVLDNTSLVINLNLYAYGIPFYTAKASTPRVVLGGGDHIGAIPIDPSWTPNEGADSKMNVIDPTTHTVFELQGYNRAKATVYWAVKKDYVSSLGDGFPQDGLAGPTGSGLTQSGGVIRMSEIASGTINHALSFITSRPVNRSRYPASHSDGTATGVGIEEGMRIQLDPSLNVDAIPGITPGEKAIAKALQQYGAYCTDNGGGNNQAMGFYVETPKAGDVNPYPAAGFAQDWAQLPHIPRDRFRVLAASATPRPN